MDDKRFSKGQNAEGYSDPTAVTAIKRADARDIENVGTVPTNGEERLNKVLRAIFSVCDAADFRIEGRITLEDRRTGKVWH